ncbi:IclR family transcriptional regulator [Micromonospora sonchi]|uniref:Glycerol operon regulatory protein n=1 Tax=Micromonospora sonchi TaxID=1763543 RepID=A0A917U8Y1_9ACTN|nr:IclR family transcriptional regulator [Micromonospora sonchi]GGM65940.1 IclR family transcriptional regulator [Micromonospora sonchi]
MTILPEPRRTTHSANRGGTAGDGAGSIKSAERVLRILDLLAGQPDGLAAPEIRSALGLPKSSLHGLLRVLCDRGYVFIDARVRRYRIGIRAWEVGQAYSRIRNVAVLVGPVMRELRDQLNETVQLAVLDGLDNLYLAKVDSEQPLRLVSGVGLRLPAHTTALGKVLLADLPTEELRRRLAGVTLARFNSRTIGDTPRLLRVLAEVRQAGYAEDDGEYTVGLFCVAVPVRDPAGTVVAALSCSMPSARAGVGPERAPNFLPALRACATRLGALMAPLPDPQDGLALGG